MLAIAGMGIKLRLWPPRLQTSNAKLSENKKASRLLIIKYCLITTLYSKVCPQRRSVTKFNKRCPTSTVHFHIPNLSINVTTPSLPTPVFILPSLTISIPPKRHHQQLNQQHQQPIAGPHKTDFLQ